MTLTCSTRLQAAACTFLIERRSPFLVYVHIEGHDVGEFGELPMRSIEAFLPPAARAELFIDARATRGATIDEQRLVGVAGPQSGALFRHPHAGWVALCRGDGGVRAAFFRTRSTDARAHQRRGVRRGAGRVDSVAREVFSAR